MGVARRAVFSNRWTTVVDVDAVRHVFHTVLAEGALPVSLMLVFAGLEWLGGSRETRLLPFNVGHDLCGASVGTLWVRIQVAGLLTGEAIFVCVLASFAAAILVQILRDQSSAARVGRRRGAITAMAAGAIVTVLPVFLT